MSVTAEIILDSVSPQNIRLTTVHLRYPRIIHAELMTHRVFCLAGDSRLDFELPSGQHGEHRRVYSMDLREFSEKWHNGAAEGKAPAHNGEFLDGLNPTTVYSAHQIAKILGFAHPMNLNKACRDGLVSGATKNPGWTAPGESWKTWRRSTGLRRFSLRSRLKQMQIRQINETSGDIQLSNVVDCLVSGTQNVFRLVAGNFSVVATKKHRIKTAKGWKRLGDIVPGVDAVLCYKYGTGLFDDPYKKIDGRWVSRWASEVRDQVAERQNWVCSETGDQLEESFHIHHVLPRHERPDLAFDLDNVVAVNPEAHRHIHEVQGWQIGVPLVADFVLVDEIIDEGLQDTYDLEIAGEFPNFFADGIVVHNSRNARSSRAVPSKRLLAEEAYVPRFLKNQPGMQGGEPLSPENQLTAEAIWNTIAKVCSEGVAALAVLGVHKQHANRPLEWFGYIDTLVTSTDWANFLALRDHRDAQPEIRELAQAVKVAFAESTPLQLSPGEWHLPYIKPQEYKYYHLGVLQKLSAARCARISYAPFDGDASIEAELERYERLVSAELIHASPTEHQATPDTPKSVGWTDSGWFHQHEHGNFRGWRQFRKMIPNECVHD